MPAPRDPVPILNVSGEDIPSCAVVEPTGVRVDGAMSVRKPTRNGFRGVWVNGECAVPAGARGQATRHPNVVVLVDGAPELGEEWGARAGSWKLGDVGGGGFICNDDAPAGGRINAVRYGVRDVDPSGSGSGSDADGDGTADRRLVGYNYDFACVGGRLQKSRQPIYQFLGSGLSSYGAWEGAGQVGCCECDDDPGDGGPTTGEFPPCDDAPEELDWASSSGDIACADGLSGAITKSGSIWSNGNQLSGPCGTDNGFVVTCLDGLWTATVDNDAGVTTTLVDQTATSLTFEAVSDGSGTLPAGTITFVVVIP